MIVARVRQMQGARRLPPRLRIEARKERIGAVDVVVSNPPYVAASDVLPPEVRDWEPLDALIPGPGGLEAYEAIVAEAGDWLTDTGALVVEIGATQASDVTDLLRIHRFGPIEVHRDLAGRDRVVVARR